MLTQLCYLMVGVTFVTSATFHHKDTLKEEQQTISPHIIGGKEVHISVCPHIVSLRRKSITCAECAYKHHCGGSIIAADTIITAAHCIIAAVPSQYQVVAGSSFSQGSDGVIVPVKEIIMHEGYNIETQDNDIAILILRSPLPLNNYTINKVELGDENPSDGIASTISGWGALSPNAQASEVLHSVKIPVISNESCDKAYGYNRITDSMLCARFAGKDSCQGDSGGPLLVDGKLAGVVSWGYGCANPLYPGVYVKVSHLRSWIMEKIALQKKFKA